MSLSRSFLAVFAIVNLSAVAYAFQPSILPLKNIVSPVCNNIRNGVLGLQTAPSHDAKRLPSGLQMSAKIQFVDPEPRMSDAAIHNQVVYTSGVVCEDEGKDVAEQTKIALDYLDNLLAKCKSDKHHIMSMQVWLADINDKPKMDAVYDAWVSKTGPPTRACVESKLQPPYLVEFRAIAAQI